MSTKRNKRPFPTGMRRFEFHNSENTYLFESITRANKYQDEFKDRAVAKCFYVDIPSDGISLRESLQHRITNWNLGGLCSLQYPSYNQIVRLFYAHATHNDDDKSIRSYVLGKELVISESNLIEWLGLSTEGDRFYVSRGDSYHGNDEEEMEKITTNEKTIAYSTKYEPHLRIAWQIGNNILAPVVKLKTNLETRNKVLLYNFWYQDTPTINIPNLIIKHMEYSLRVTTSSLPYGHIITLACFKAGIVIPETEWSFGKVTTENLLTLERLEVFGLTRKGPRMGLDPFQRNIRAGHYYFPEIPSAWVPSDLPAQETAHPPSSSRGHKRRALNDGSSSSSQPSFTIDDIQALLEAQTLTFNARFDAQTLDFDTLLQAQTQTIQTVLDTHTLAIKTHNEAMRDEIFAEHALIRSHAVQLRDEMYERMDSKFEDVNRRLRDDDDAEEDDSNGDE